MESIRAECNSGDRIILVYEYHKYEVWNLEGQNVTAVLGSYMNINSINIKYVI